MQAHLCSAQGLGGGHQQNAQQAAIVPHVSSCNFCFECLLERPTNGADPHQAPGGSLSDSSAASTKRLLLHDSQQTRQAHRNPTAERSASHVHGVHDVPSLASLHDQRVEEHAYHHQRRLRQSAGQGMWQPKRFRRPPAPPRPVRTPSPPRPPQPPEPKPERDLSIEPHLDPFNYMPTAQDVIPKQHLPNCTVCWGCSTTLVPMANATTLFGRTYANEAGATR